MKRSFADSEWRIKAAGLAIRIHGKTQERNVMEFLHKVINKSWQGAPLKGMRLLFFPFFRGFPYGWTTEGGQPQDRVSGASPRSGQGSKGAMGSKGANNGSSWKSTSVYRQTS